MGYCLDDQVSITQQGGEIFVSSSKYLGLLPQAIGWCVMLTTHFHLVLKSRIVELYLYSIVHIHGMVTNAYRVHAGNASVFLLAGIECTAIYKLHNMMNTA
jgi:hypothetical protein